MYCSLAPLLLLLLLSSSLWLLILPSHNSTFIVSFVHAPHSNSYPVCVLSHSQSSLGFAPSLYWIQCGTTSTLASTSAPETGRRTGRSWSTRLLLSPAKTPSTWDLYACYSFLSVPTHRSIHVVVHTQCFLLSFSIYKYVVLPPLFHTFHHVLLSDGCRICSLWQQNDTIQKFCLCLIPPRSFA